MRGGEWAGAGPEIALNVSAGGLLFAGTTPADAIGNGWSDVHD